MNARLAIGTACALAACCAQAAWTLEYTNNPRTAFRLSDDDGNWILTGTANSGNLTVNGVEQGTGSLDLSDFVGPDGEALVAISTGQNAGSLFKDSGLTSVSLPQSVTSLGVRAFYQCADLENISMPGLLTVGQYGFQNCSSLGPDVSLPSVTTIQEGAFNGCTSLESLSVPSIVRINGKRYSGTFYQLPKLRSLTLGENLEYIGPDAFNFCTNLKTVIPSMTLPNLRTIDAAAFEKAFADTTGLQFPTNLPALETIGDNAFYSCGFTSLEFPALRTIGSNAFYGSALVSFTATNCVTIGSGAFTRCNSLADIVFPALETLGSAFRYDSALKGDMVWPNLHNIYGGNTFESAGFTSVVAPALTNIANAAFRGCSKMTNVVISQQCKRIGDTAFYGCSSLTRIDPFLPKDMDAIGSTPFTQFSSLAGTFVWDQAKLTDIPASLLRDHKGITNYIIKTPVTSIGASAFASIGHGATFEFHCPAPSFGDKTFYQYRYNGAYNYTEREDRLRFVIRSAAALPSWKALAAPNEELFNSDYKNIKADYPGKRTLGIILIATDASYPGYAWLVDGTVRGLFLSVR